MGGLGWGIFPSCGDASGANGGERRRGGWRVASGTARLDGVEVFVGGESLTGDRRGWKIPLSGRLAIDGVTMWGEATAGRRDMTKHFLREDRVRTCCDANAAKKVPDPNAIKLSRADT